MTLAPDSRLRRNAHVRYRRIQDETIALQQTVGEVLVLSEVGGRILELLDGERTLETVAEVLEREYDAPLEVLRRDVLEFAQALVAADLAEPDREEDR